VVWECHGRKRKGKREFGESRRVVMGLGEWGRKRDKVGRNPMGKGKKKNGKEKGIKGGARKQGRKNVAGGGMEEKKQKQLVSRIQ